MPSSNQITLAAGIGFLAFQPLAADSLSLANDSRISGTIRSIRENGSLVIETPLSTEPLEIRGEAVRSVSFSGQPGEFSAPPTRIELTNGDVLPVEIRSMDEKNLMAESPLTGPLTIPRNSIRSLQMGMVDSRVIYSGPDGIEGWKSDAGRAMAWGFEGGNLKITGSGRISRKLEVSENFIVRFTLSWDRNPGFHFSFADSLQPISEKSDRYYVTFSSAGLEIKRESSQGPRYPSLATINRGPETFAGNKVKVELRVDRKRKLIYLYLNDQFEGRYIDPSSVSPPDGGVSLTSTSNQGAEQQVSEIEVLEWDPSGERHRTEERGDVKQDALIASDAARFGGKLVSIRPSEEGPLFSFKSDFGDDLIELPESQVSTVFFAEKEEAEDETPRKPLKLRLRGNGSIQVDSCSFTEDKAEVNHPLLGKLTLFRNGIATLERSAPQDQSDPNP
jgi:hypothetical protein